MKTLVVALLTIAVAAVAEGQTVDMDIQPATATMNVGQTITIAVRGIAGANEVDNVEADLNFDPTVFQAVSITPRAGFSSGASTIDNALGQANASYATSAAFVTGTFFVVDVALQAIAPSAGSVVSFNTAFPRISAASRIGVPYTGTFTPATIVVLSATATPTNAPPTLTPTPGGVTPTAVSSPCGTAWPTCGKDRSCVPLPTP